ncbi:hypothetical protein PR202_gb13471 [Eleusine coracana subsp. coracana]|uniref:Secreted protein n=1 Tax=Eleusine coracana subsp. coracana TaxID=191504 RepID=A0AAV5ES63_ELECO|nr:hypothetical protein PR202_gb13471 [Eleusine coracana subsp. coracana]
MLCGAAWMVVVKPAMGWVARRANAAGERCGWRRRWRGCCVRVRHRRHRDELFGAFVFVTSARVRRELDAMGIGIGAGENTELDCVC